MELEHALAHRQGVEHVVPKPGAHGDVPPAPVLGDVLGEEGPLEVLGDLHSQHLGHADGDVDAAGEVGVELHGVEEHHRQHVEPGVLLRRGGELPQGDGQPVGDDELFAQAPQGPHAAHGDWPGIPAVLGVQGLAQVVIAADGTLDQLGEEGDEEGEPAQTALRGVLAPVHVDEVAHGLEGVEGYAKRKQKSKLPRIWYIFKECQYAEIAKQRKQHDCHSLFSALFLVFLSGLPVPVLLMAFYDSILLL